MDGAAVWSAGVLLVLVRSCWTSVIADTPSCRPGSPARTTWLPRTCSS